MRGKDDQQLDVFSYISPEQRAPQDHPLRTVPDEALHQPRPRFDKLCAKIGQPRSHRRNCRRFADYALASPVKAGVPKERILNFMNVDDLRDWAPKVRHAQTRAARTESKTRADHKYGEGPGLRLQRRPNTFAQANLLPSFFRLRQSGGPYIPVCS